MRRVSIVVDNHDYANYLSEAIESCLAQNWPDVETVVVDDGSTDASRDLLAGYQRQVRVVLQENRGQASAFAAGLEASSGDVVIFLDADDLLLPSASRAAAEALDARPDVVKLSWPMWEIDAAGRRTGGRLPSRVLSRGNLRPVVLAQGADSYVSSPTSGNAWSRSFLRQVLPGPEEDFRRGADGYLITVAPLFGLVDALERPQSCYRIHDRNGFWKRSLEERVAGALTRHEARSRALQALRNRMALHEDEPHVENPYVSWLRRLDAVVADVRRAVPAGASFLLLDGGEWGARLLADRAHVPFTERDGVYWGPPADDAAAAAELDRHRADGVRFAVVGWPAFWWLDAYPALAGTLEVLHATDDVRICRL